MNTVRPTRSAFLGLLLIVAGLLCLAAPASARADDTYAAIAYSENTMRYGYSYGYSTRADAEARALKECNTDDAKVVIWCRNAYAALAVSDEGFYGYAWASTERQAKSIAAQKCRDFGGVHVRIAVSVFSGD
jgi:hypothetical protein